MKYIVFEAGSRAGMSSLLFFLDFTNGNDELYLVDSDEIFKQTVKGRCPKVKAYTEEEFALIYPSIENESTIFPADELTRQKGLYQGKEWYNKVEKDFYNKIKTNERLEKFGINVPETMSMSEVFIRPNTMSAGSKGVYGLNDVCVTKKIDIEQEYVVDVVYKGGTPVILDTVDMFVREVRLNKGYDKYIKFLGTNDVHYFVLDLFRKGVFGKGVFNIQIARQRGTGKLYYIESSKRISGTSIVNLLIGYNPFNSINGIEVEQSLLVQYDKWYSYEQLLKKVYDKIPKYN